MSGNRNHRCGSVLVSRLFSSSTVEKAQPSYRFHQTSRKPIWIRRGVLAWAVIVAKAVLVALRLGAAKVTRLVMLKPSKRTCRNERSPSENLFSMDRSAFLVGSRRRLLNCESKTRMLSEGCRFEAVKNRVVSKVGPFGSCGLK